MTDTIAAVVRAEPDWSALPPDVPEQIRLLLKRCLEKDRRKRVSDIGVARFLMTETIAPSTAPVTAPQTEPPAVPAHRRHVVAGTSIGLAAGIALTALAGWIVTRLAARPSEPVRFAIVPPPAQPLALQGADRDIAISPDGRHIVYRAGGTGAGGNAQLMVRTMDQLDARPLAGITNARGPFISPDGHWVGFFSAPELKKVSIAGGPPITLARYTGTPRGASWGSDDTIVFATNDTGTGLLSVPGGGGEPKVLTKPDPTHGELDHLFPFVLPGARAVLFAITVPGQPIENAQIAVLDLKTGQRKILVRGGGQAEYVDASIGSGQAGYLVYGVAGTMRAVRFDLGRLEVTSDPVPVVEQVTMTNTGGANFALSRGGTLVYVPGGGATGAGGAQRSLVWVTRQGREEVIKAPPRAYTFPRISPDGTRVALDIRDQENDIWIWDTGRQTLTRLTFDPGNDQFPVWTPDGRRVIFSSVRGGGVPNVYWQAADGTGTVERLTTSTNPQFAAYSMSPDAMHLLFVEVGSKTNLDIHDLSFGNQRSSQPLIQTSFSESNADISPDGRWVVYQSNESGQDQIYVRPYPKVDSGRWQVSAGGGTRPVWARTGKELFYLDGTQVLTAVPVQIAGPTFSEGNPAKVFDARYFVGNAGRTYDVSPDGQRFLMIKDNASSDQASTAPPASMVVVLNWFEELKARLPAR